MVCFYYTVLLHGGKSWVLIPRHLSHINQDKSRQRNEGIQIELGILSIHDKICHPVIQIQYKKHVVITVYLTTST